MPEEEDRAWIGRAFYALKRAFGSHTAPDDDDAAVVAVGAVGAARTVDRTTCELGGAAAAG